MALFALDFRHLILRLYPCVLLRATRPNWKENPTVNLAKSVINLIYITEKSRKLAEVCEISRANNFYWY